MYGTINIKSSLVTPNINHSSTHQLRTGVANIVPTPSPNLPVYSVQYNVDWIGMQRCYIVSYSNPEFTNKYLYIIFTCHSQKEGTKLCCGTCLPVMWSSLFLSLHIFKHIHHIPQIGCSE